MKTKTITKAVNLAEQERLRIVASAFDLLMTFIYAGRIHQCTDNFLCSFYDEVIKLAKPRKLNDFKKIKLGALLEMSKSPDSVLYPLMSWRDDQKLIDDYLDNINEEKKPGAKYIDLITGKVTSTGV